MKILKEKIIFNKFNTALKNAKKKSIYLQKVLNLILEWNSD